MCVASGGVVGAYAGWEIEERRVEYLLFPGELMIYSMTGVFMAGIMTAPWCVALGGGAMALKRANSYRKCFRACVNSRKVLAKNNVYH
jgi:hypothetical protein